MEPGITTLNDYFEILKRRKWSIILPFCTIFIIAVIVALTLPSIYSSTSTILIEEQDVPDEFVTSLVTSYAEQRLQAIHQRVISFSTLSDIIKKFNLYPELKNKWTAEEIVEKMRSDIGLKTTNAARKGRGRESTAISFKLSYKGENPRKVQQVANVLTTLILEENLQVREKQATDTAEFLETEMNKIKADLTKLSNKMVAFKKTHMGELPDLLQVNVQSLNNAENNIERLKEHLRSLGERETYLQTQLVDMNSGKGTADGKSAELFELKSQLADLESSYSDRHPDVIKVKAKIAKLEKALNEKPTREGESPSLNDTSRNPAYLALSNDLSRTRTETESIQRQIVDANKIADQFRLHIANTPIVEEKYNSILNEINTTQAKYDDLMRKHLEAKVAQGLETEQKGERFTVIDAARLPEKPNAPNRVSIVLIGLVLGLGTGLGWCILRELMDDSIRKGGTLVDLTSFPVLGSIPEIVTRKDIRKKRMKRVAVALSIILVTAIGLWVFHHHVMNLNVFFVKVVRKIQLHI